MTDQPRITLPDAASLTELLARWDSTNTHYMEQLYPAICYHLANRTETPQSIVMALALAIGDYTRSMPKVIDTALVQQIGDIIEAITPEGVFREEALKKWDRMRATMK